MEKQVVLSAKNVSKKFCMNLRRSMIYGIADLSKNLFGLKPDSTKLKKNEFWALDGINFELRRGEALGLIGINGSGKTTLLRLLSGIFPPDRGEILIQGKIGALIAVGAGFHPHMTGRENIFLNGAILGMSKKNILRHFDSIVDFAGIDDFLDAPVSTYSSGMHVRLGFAIATAINPDILLIDEILAVGDSNFRMKCFKRIGDIMDKCAVIFVSHDITQLSRICNKIMVLDKGKNIYSGETQEGLDRYNQLLSLQNRQSYQPILNDNIIFFSCAIHKNIIQNGEILMVKLSFNATEKIQTGLCLIAIEAQDTPCAQTDFSKFLPIIEKGISTFYLELGPLYLRKDEYSLTVTILNKTKKSTLVHSRNGSWFNVIGERGYGVAYQFPCNQGQPDKLVDNNFEYIP